MSSHRETPASPATPRTAAQITRDHRAAVARAHQSGWATDPVPTHVLDALGHFEPPTPAEIRRLSRSRR